MTKDFDRQTEYWDQVAGNKEFTHPVDLARFLSLTGKEGRILDIGCGYGRLCSELAGAGVCDIVGVDISAKMIQRGRSLFPALDLRVLEGEELPFSDGAFDGALLFAVLTCIPSDEGQRTLIGEVRRVLKPGGVLYLSAYPLQDDERSRKRYDAFAEHYGTYGVFELSDGGVVRHMSREWLMTLLEPFEQLARGEVDVLTMNGHAARVVQYLGKVAAV